VRVRPRGQPDGRVVPAFAIYRLRLSDAGIAVGRQEADLKGLANARFEKRDAAHLGENGRFDFITTFDAVHDQARPDLMLAGIAAALRPGGVYLCVDTSASSKLAENLDHPLGPWLYTACRACTV
jgi:2-polyprenyl-3-methyl-5-hydroxy-6-metoxy-1,4-benzoquinol methylase